jgi:hypothetical protein
MAEVGRLRFGLPDQYIVTKVPFYKLRDETAHYTASVAGMGSIR